MLALAVLACGTSVITQVLPIAAQLPAPEQLRYQILSDSGKNLGEVTLSIARNGSTLTLASHVQAGNGSTNDAATTVDAGTLEPMRVERSNVLTGHRYDIHETYAKGVLTVMLVDGVRAQTRTRTLPESAYDDQESLFLWRSLNFTPGYVVRYVNVVVNPQTGEISRPMAEAHVVRRESIAVPSGSFNAWRVEFSAAGFVNTAWYEDSPSRRLLKYRIPAQGVTYVLAPGQ